MATTLEPRIDYTSSQPSSALALTIRILFRRLGLFHAFRHDRKLITIDVPFQLKTTQDGRRMAILLDKTCLPRKYTLDRLFSSRPILERNLGTQVEIRQTGKWIAFCLEGGRVFNHEQLVIG